MLFRLAPSAMAAGRQEFSLLAIQEPRCKSHRPSGVRTTGFPERRSRNRGRRAMTTEATEGTEDTADLIRNWHLSRTLLSPLSLPALPAVLVKKCLGEARKEATK